MQEFLHALMQFPTVIFTGLLGLSLFYWLLIIVGAADLNPFDGLEGSLDGAEGAVKGAVEGAVKGAVEGAAKGVVEGAGEGAGHGAAAVKGASAITELLSFLGLKKVPVTISFSLFSLFGWFLAFATRHSLDPLVPGWISALAATGAGILGGLAVTSFLTRPLSHLFQEGTRPGGEGLVGRSVKVTTERADHTFGQGEIDDGAGGITVAIRTAPGVTMKRGDEGIVIEVDVEKGLYTIEPARTLLPDDKAAFEAAARAGAAQAAGQAEVPAEPVPNPAGDRNRT
jgi:hypothetical protein